MVFGWFSGDPYEKMKKKLEELAVFETLMIEDLGKEKLSKAKKHEKVLRDVLEDLLARFISSKARFYGIDWTLAGRLGSLMDEIKAAIEQLPSFEDMRQLMEEGLEAGGLEKELSQIKASLKTIREKIAESEAIVAQLKKKADEKEAVKGKEGGKEQASIFPLNPARRILTDEYERKLAHYSSWRKNIGNVMARLETVPYYVDTLHEVWKHGKYAGYRHARFAKNLRIMYIFNPKTREITYETILTKNELEQT